MGHSRVNGGGTANPESKGGYCPRPKARKVNERTQELCSAAKALMNRTQQLLQASRHLQRACNELLRDADMLMARVNRYARGRGSAALPFDGR